MENNFENISFFNLLKKKNSIDKEMEITDRCYHYELQLKKDSKKNIESPLKRLINRYISNDEFNLKEIENLIDDSNLTFSYLDASNFPINDIKFIDFLFLLLKEGLNLATIYLALYFLYFVNYKNISTQNKKILITYSYDYYTYSHALFILRNDKNYAEIHHKSYYKNNIQNNLVDFYLDYPDETDTSLYFALIHNKNVNLPQIKNEDEFDQEAFLNLIKKYTTSLDDFNTEKNCIIDFDNFFKNKPNIIMYLNLLLDMELDIDKLNLSKLILILFSRTNNFNTLKFAITFSRQFKINKFFNRLFKDIESLALNPYLTASCFIALSNHNNSNAIYRKIAKKLNQEQFKNILLFFDPSDKQNIHLILNRIEPLSYSENYVDYLIENCNIYNLISACSNKELNHLVDLIIRYYLFNEENTIENLDKIISIIYNERFDFVKHIHFLTTTLLKTFSQRNDSISKKIIDIINSKTNYDDEITYIDNCLSNGTFETEEILAMLTYYEYNPLDLLKYYIFKNPDIYFVFIPYFYNKADNSIMDILDMYEDLCDNKDFSLKNNLLFLNIMADLLYLSNKYFKNLYNLGLTCFEPNIRFKYFRNIINIYNSEFSNENILEVINKFYQIETDENILLFLDDCLNNRKIIN